DDILSQYQIINDGRILVSVGKKFQLGFFSPGKSRIDTWEYGATISQFSPGSSQKLIFLWAWKLWIEEKVFKLVDEQMEDYSISTSKVVKCIQVGLLCVQKCPEDRPTMAYVLAALESESAMMAQPKQPGFYTEGDSLETEVPLVGKQCGTAEMTLTMMSAR
ncbi:chitinase, partial [Sarracenia purpurea var. burkii]